MTDAVAIAEKRYCVYSETLYIKNIGYDLSGNGADSYYSVQKEADSLEKENPFTTGDFRFRLPFSNDFGYHYLD